MGQSTGAESADQPLQRGLPWHQALVLAITGEPTPEAGVQRQPDLSAVADLLAARRGGLERLREEIAARRTTGEPWPYPIPAELRTGLGAAQLTAAVAELRRRLRLDEPDRPVLNDRPLDADERRLIADRPPHHGH